MEDFNVHEWREHKRLQETCSHPSIRCEAGVMTNDCPIMRFICEACFMKFISLQMDVNDADRTIFSKKHPDKKLSDIAVVDMPYLHWVAVKSKLPQSERYACARMFIGRPYIVPADGERITEDMLYQNYVRMAKDFIRSQGGIV